jgi:beta-glucosidase
LRPADKAPRRRCRSPLGGRGFESLSEDPLLSGRIASALIAAVQDQGIASAVKHFAANDMEHERTSVDCIISPRALREIYLMPFQIALREANPWCLMTSYNRVNGTHMSEHRQILQDIVRGEWAYDGCIVSDWYGTYSTVDALNAGLDIEMPGPSAWRGQLIKSAIGVGKLSPRVVGRSASRVVDLAVKCSRSRVLENGPEGSLDSQADRALMARLAAESIVLLKNDGNVLPFKAGEKTAVIGPNATHSFLSGGGSASLTPYRAVSIYDGLASRLDNTPSTAEGCQIHKSLPVLGDRLIGPGGKVGTFEMRIHKTLPAAGFDDDDDESPPPTAIDVFELSDTNIVLYDYSNPKITDGILYAEIEARLVVDQSGLYDFGLTVAGSARLWIDSELVLSNWESQTRGDSFFGSGTIEERTRISLEAGRSYRFKCLFGSAATAELNSAGAPVFGFGGVRIGCALAADSAAMIDEAVQLATSVEQVVLCVGLGPDWETEGSDRTEYGLPGQQAELIAKVCKANPNTVVVIQSGTPVAGPWDAAPAILQAWYGGNEGGFGVADVLLGTVNPSGKLSQSWPRQIEDCPAFTSYRAEGGKCRYNDDIFVGYRGLEKRKAGAGWAFGHGLSYASFALRNVDSVLHGQGLESELVVSFAVANTSSSVAGREVCQAYVAREGPSVVSRPVKELKAFTKVFVPPLEERGAVVKLSVKHATSVWDEAADAWLMEAGKYAVLIGNSSASTSLRVDFSVPVSAHWNGL